jgi:hypothetical protein
MLTPPPDIIVARKVGKRELYRIFNDPDFRADIMRRTNQRVDVYEALASEDCHQEPGTMSHVYDWMEYDPAENQMKLLATVHCFKRPDGSLGASGDYDPVLLAVGGQILIDP